MVIEPLSPRRAMELVTKMAQGPPESTCLVCGQSLRGWAISDTCPGVCTSISEIRKSLAERHPVAERIARVPDSLEAWFAAEARR